MTAEERKQILETASAIVTKDRNSAYGNPEDNFASIADFWTVWLFHRGKLKNALTKIDVQDVAMMMSLMKDGRIATGAPMVIDNYVDGAGYKAIAWEMDLRLHAQPVESASADEGIEWETIQPKATRTSKK